MLTFSQIKVNHYKALPCTCSFSSLACGPFYLTPEFWYLAKHKIYPIVESTTIWTTPQNLNRTGKPYKLILMILGANESSRYVCLAIMCWSCQTFIYHKVLVISCSIYLKHILQYIWASHICIHIYIYKYLNLKTKSKVKQGRKVKENKSRTKNEKTHMYSTYTPSQTQHKLNIELRTGYIILY